MTSLFSAFILLVAGLLVSGLALWRLWKRVGNRVEFFLYIIVAFACLIQLAPGLAWCLALLPPINNPEHPYITGIGGSAYGMKYEMYPWAALFFILSSFCIILVGYISFPKRKSLLSFHPIQELRSRVKQQSLIRAATFGLVASVVYLVGSCSLLGWEIIWSVDVARKEIADRMLFGFVAHKVMVLGAFFLSLPMVVFVLIGDIRVRLLSVVAIFLFSLPSVALASRRGSVLLVLVIVMLAIRSKRRMLFIGPAIVVSLYLYLLPLVMRIEIKEGSGLYYVGKATAILFDPGNFDFNREAIRFLCNFGQGFGVFAEFLEYEVSGTEIMAGVPWSYYLISISPFPSIIDNYQARYFQYHARVNQFTPFNAYAEIASINMVVGVLFVPIIVMMCAFLLKVLGGRNVIFLGAGVCVCAGALLMLLHLQQYNLRQASRFFIYPVDMAIGLWLLFGALRPKRELQSKSSIKIANRNLLK